jgi:hypothetical protein
LNYYKLLKEIKDKNMNKAHYISLLSQTMLEPEGIALSKTYANRTKKQLRKFWEDTAIEYIAHTHGVDLNDKAIRDAYRIIVETDLEAEGTVRVFIRRGSPCTGFSSVTHIREFDDYKLDKNLLFEFLK